MNSIIIIGNLTNAPETRATPAGKQVCSFTVAVNRARKGRDGNRQADFFRVVAWEPLGLNCAAYLSKGKKVAVDGELQTRAYEKDGQKHYTFEILARNVEFLTPKGGDQHEELGGFEDVADPDLPF